MSKPIVPALRHPFPRSTAPKYAAARLAALGLWLWAGLAACAEPEISTPALAESASRLVRQAGDWAILGALALAGLALTFGFVWKWTKRARPQAVAAAVREAAPNPDASRPDQSEAEIGRLPILLRLAAFDALSSHGAQGRALNRFLAHCEDGARFQPRLVGFAASDAALKAEVLARLAEAAWRNNRDVAIIDATLGEAEPLVRALDGRMGGRAGDDMIGAAARIEMIDAGDLSEDGPLSHPKRVRRALDAVASGFDLVLVDLPMRDLGLAAAPALLAALDEVALIHTEGDAMMGVSAWLKAEADGVAPLAGRIVVAREAVSRAMAA